MTAIMPPEVGGTGPKFTMIYTMVFTAVVIVLAVVALFGRRPAPAR